MNQAVLASIQPEYCAYIGMGIKSNEVRKTAPNLKPPFKCYIYCARKTAVWWWLKKPYSADFKMQRESIMGQLPLDQPYPPHPMAGPAHNLGMYGKVVAEFVCDFVTHYPQRELNGEMRYIITPQELKTTCLTYDQIAEYGAGKDLYFWHISDLKVYDTPKDLAEFKPWHRECKYSDLGFAIPKCEDCHACKVERPPQSWCYVEELASA